MVYVWVHYNKWFYLIKKNSNPFEVISMIAHSWNWWGNFQFRFRVLIVRSETFACYPFAHPLCPSPCSLPTMLRSSFSRQAATSPPTGTHFVFPTLSYQWHCPCLLSLSQSHGWDPKLLEVSRRTAQAEFSIWMKNALKLCLSLEWRLSK